MECIEPEIMYMYVLDYATDSIHEIAIYGKQCINTDLSIDEINNLIRPLGLRDSTCDWMFSSVKLKIEEHTLINIDK